MPDSRATFVTTTSYGTWLPGDARGYVCDGKMLPANSMLEHHCQTQLLQSPVLFSDDDRQLLLASLESACGEFGYVLYDLAIESWHLHWIVKHTDSVDAMVGRLKTRMRQALGRGRIWTAGYCHRVIKTEDELLHTRNYIRQHDGCVIIDRRRVGEP
jgi:hypothetical protein